MKFGILTRVFSNPSHDSGPSLVIIIHQLSRCRGHANPGNISVAWYRFDADSGRERRLTSTPRVKVKTDGTLYFEKVVSGDEGRYTCKVGGNLLR